ncbi:MAG: CoA transferase [Anaerolineae bacterium]|nr:CoA transferase [Anaerolineae bacterium]
MTNETQGPLAGLRVADFSRVLAGPFCTMMLADLGADVIKVERPGKGDDTRHWGPPWFGEGDSALSAYFVSVNRNKRSLSLNLKAERGQQLARDLAAGADVVVENLKVGNMARYGLAYDDLHALNPKLVYCSITGFGQTGPYRERPGYDYVIQAMSGLMAITGPVEGPPYKVGVAISDVIAGLFAATSILAAVRDAEQTGQGRYIDVSLLDTSIAALVNVISNVIVSGQAPRRYGNQHPNIVPYQTFRAADGEFVLAVGNDGQYAKLCDLLERPDLRDDARFVTNPVRVQHREILGDVLGEIFATRPAAEWVERCLAAGIPAGPINDLPDVLDDPHINARGLIHAVDVAGETLRMIGPAAQFTPDAATVRTPPPQVGEHTDAVLREVLGLDDAAIADLRTGGVV